MIFKEKKTESGYWYQCEDIFGTIELDSPIQLDAGMLDQVSVYIIHQTGSTASEITGSIKPSENSTQSIEYTFHKAPTWIEDDEEDDEALTFWQKVKRLFRRIKKWFVSLLWRLIGSRLHRAMQNSDTM